MAVVKLKNVYKQYGQIYALHDVSFEVKKGEFISIMGPSGSGKTTLLNLISCLDQPSKGQIIINSKKIGELSQKELTLIRREEVGLVFQQFHLIPYLTAVENVMLAQYYHSMPDKQEALEALARVGLAERADHFPSQLSGGEQQRVCIARALINAPAIILADEPTGNLDEENEHRVVEIFQQLHQEGHTIILVTHDPEIGRLAQRQINLEHGKIVRTNIYHSDLQRERS